MTTAGDSTPRPAWRRMSRWSRDRWRASISSTPTASADRAAAGRDTVPDRVRHHRYRPGEIAVIPRGVKFKVELIGGPARGYVCENYGGAFTLPDRGPIGANCLANPRDFKTPVAAYEDREEPSTLDVKWGGGLRDRNRPVAARRRRLARQLRALQIRPAPLLAGRRDPVRPPRPSIFTVLTAPSETPAPRTSTSSSSRSAGGWPSTPSGRPGTT